MDCPVCAAPLVAVEHRQIEVDWCLMCRGIWFDEGELQLLGKSLQLPHQEPDFSDLLNLPAVASAEKPRRCPRCRARMDKVQMGEAAHQTLVDRCPRGNGLWFDGGELGRVLGCRGPIVHFLEEAFGQQLKHSRGG